MRISDWSSDVCSSDLGLLQQRLGLLRVVLVVTSVRDLTAVIGAVGIHHRVVAARAAGDGDDLVDRHDAADRLADQRIVGRRLLRMHDEVLRSEEHTSELQSLLRITYAVFWL